MHTNSNCELTLSSLQLTYLESVSFRHRLDAPAASQSSEKMLRLAQEIGALVTSLPLSTGSSVFVRCHEERMDVMKFLVTGPLDTPYAFGTHMFGKVVHGYLHVGFRDQLR